MNKSKGKTIHMCTLFYKRNKHKQVLLFDLWCTLSHSMGGTEQEKFCEFFELVVADTLSGHDQQNVLHILQPWRKYQAIDNNEAVRKNFKVE